LEPEGCSTVSGEAHRSNAEHQKCGKSPKWMVKKHQLEAWQTFSDELPKVIFT